MKMENLERERKLYKRHLRRRFLDERKLRQVLDSMVRERNEAYAINEEQKAEYEGMADDGQMVSALVVLVSDAIWLAKLSQKMRIEVGSDRSYQMRVRASWRGIFADGFGKAMQ